MAVVLSSYFSLTLLSGMLALLLSFSSPVIPPYRVPSLPFVSPSLARAGKILSPPGGLCPLDIVAELAALDGLKDHSKSVRALEQARKRDEHVQASKITVMAWSFGSTKAVDKRRGYRRGSIDADSSDSLAPIVSAIRVFHSQRSYIDRRERRVFLTCLVC